MNQELYRLITIAYKARETYRKAQEAYVAQKIFQVMASANCLTDDSIMFLNPPGPTNAR